MKKPIRGKRGFTLVEILVVIFIISIVTSVALFTVGRNTNKAIELFSNELVEIITLAEEEAMLQPLVLGMVFHERTITWVFLANAKDNRRNSWLPLNNSILKTSRIPDDMDINLLINRERVALTDKKNKELPQIIISMNGEVTPFNIYIGKKGDKPHYLIIGDSNGNITKQAL